MKKLIVDEFRSACEGEKVFLAVILSIYRRLGRNLECCQVCQVFVVFDSHCLKFVKSPSVNIRQVPSEYCQMSMVWERLWPERTSSGFPIESLHSSFDIPSPTRPCWMSAQCSAVMLGYRSFGSERKNTAAKFRLSWMSAVQFICRYPSLPSGPMILMEMGKSPVAASTPTTVTLANFSPGMRLPAWSYHRLVLVQNVFPLSFSFQRSISAASAIRGILLLSISVIASSVVFPVLYRKMLVPSEKRITHSSRRSGLIWLSRPMKQRVFPFSD